jgi:hypothetical protein
MTGSDVALVITAITTTLTAVGGIAVAVIHELRLNRDELKANTVVTEKTRKDVKANTEVTEATHILVNSQHDDLITAAEAQDTRIDTLIAALRSAGVAIPQNGLERR